MKLLILTQKVDKNDPILGFFHRWIEEFAKRYDSVIVVCLGEGEYNLPQNVKVLSLGKEKGFSRLKYIENFYKYVWQERKNYDFVFVHMNQEYVLLGGLIWKILRKKIYLWRNHLKGNFLTRLAVLLANRVFCTSSKSFTARFKKTKLMPVGIDTDFFKPDPLTVKIPNSILFLGRISPVKNVDIFIEALNELNRQGIDFVATVAGSALDRDRYYEDDIRKKVDRFNLSKKVKFTGPVNQSGARVLYQNHRFYVNLTPSGSMDKTIFEAMACGVTPLVANQDLKSVLGKNLITSDTNFVEIAEKIKNVLLGESEKGFRDFIIKKHSLASLVGQIREENLKC